MMKLSAKWELSAIPEGKIINNPLLFQLETPPASGSPQQLVVVLALDRSWSMKGEKMAAITDAAILFLNWLTRNDALGIVTYAQDVKVCHNPALLTDKTIVQERIRNIQLGTSTNLSGGWLQALRLAENFPAENTIRRVILLTDGQATMGVREDEKLVEIAKQYAARGIHTSTIGVGNDFNEQSLRQIARAGEGSFYFIETPEQAADIFYQEFGNIRSLYAQAPEIRFSLPNNVKLKSVLADAEVETSESGAIVRTGDIPADDQRKIVMDFAMTASSTDLAIAGELVFFNVSNGMKEEKLRFRIPVKIAATTAEPNKTVSEEYIIALSARKMEQISQLAAQDATQAAQQIQQLEEEISALMREKTIQIPWLNERIKNMMAKLAGDSNLARKYMLAESARMFRSRNLQGRIVNDREVLRDALTENLDLYKVPEFNDKMNAHLAAGIRFILLDLSRCAFLDSSAIGALIQLSNSLVKRGGLLVVYSIPATLEKIFTSTRLDKFIPVVENEQAALALLPKE